MDFKQALRFARYSSYSYSDEMPFIDGHDVTFIENKKTDTQCYVLSNHRQQIVVFRGTEASISNTKDIITDLDCRIIRGTHAGFMEAYESVSEDINKALKPHKHTVFTGHSLGGALAKVAGARYRSSYKLIVTFGAPRVFSKKTAIEFESYHGDCVVRFENTLDPIPYMPLERMGFFHIGNSHKLGSWWSAIFPSVFSKIGLGKSANAHSIDTYIKNLEGMTG